MNGAEDRNAKRAPEGCGARLALPVRSASGVAGVRTPTTTDEDGKSRSLQGKERGRIDQTPLAMRRRSSTSGYGNTLGFPPGRARTDPRRGARQASTVLHAITPGARSRSPSSSAVMTPRSSRRRRPCRVLLPRRPRRRGRASRRHGSRCVRDPALNPCAGCRRMGAIILTVGQLLRRADRGHTEPGVGIEPTTYRLQGGCSTD